MQGTPAVLSGSGSILKRLRAGDPIVYTITVTAAASILAITALLVYHLWTDSALPREKFGWSFVTGQVWDPVAAQFMAITSGKASISPSVRRVTHIGSSSSLSILRIRPASG